MSDNNNNKKEMDELLSRFKDINKNFKDHSVSDTSTDKKTRRVSQESISKQNNNSSSAPRGNKEKVAGSGKAAKAPAGSPRQAARPAGANAPAGSPKQATKPADAKAPAGSPKQAAKPAGATATAGGQSSGSNKGGQNNGTGNLMSRKTKKKRKHTKKPWSRKKKILYAILAFIAACLLAAIIYTVAVIATTPKFDTNDVYATLSQSSILYDDNGKELYKAYEGDENRVNVDYDEIPKDMVNAIVSIEDKTFWKHHGFNFVRILGAIKESMFNSSGIHGTSTITQQLARNIYLPDSKSERTLSRKIREAYYTALLEKNLSKEKIVEAYLNTVSFGFGSYGIQSAAKAYFSKNAKDLTLIECAALAAIPQSPTDNALILRYEKGSISSDDPNFISQDDQWVYYYNGSASEERRNLVLKLMKTQGYITAEDYSKALDKNLMKRIKPTYSQSKGIGTYFCDYVISQVVDDLVAQNGMDKTSATNLVYRGGLTINTTLDRKMQKTMERTFKDSYNFPGTTNLNTDWNGNIITSSGDISMYNYNNYFNSENDFVLHSDEYKWAPNGDLLIFSNKRLNIYAGSDGSSNINFYKMYTIDYDGKFYCIEGGSIMVPSESKNIDSNGNAVVSAKFIKDNPKFFNEVGGEIYIKKDYYTLNQKLIQPQAAMVITKSKTGEIKAMTGGRGAEGQQLYNRSTSPRQPGSSIKPLAVYGAALQQGKDANDAKQNQNFSYTYENGGRQLYGSVWTAASVINDSPMYVNGVQWPKNWYNSFKGYVTMRTAVEQSINVCAVKVFSEVGAEYSADMLEKYGVTSLIREGSVNDMNAAALALGGMSKGISPLEMTAAYGAINNGGVYIAPSSYTTVTNSKGEEILKAKPETHRVLDKGVAWILRDILRSTVSEGIASGASIGIQPVAGKTGTTTDNYDAWFVGMTPRYSAAVWIGNDMNIELTEGSASATRLWNTVMYNALLGKKYRNFSSAPSNVTYYNGEYFIVGTEADIPVPQLEETVNICADTGMRATEYCPHVINKTYSAGSEDDLYSQIPDYCTVHNKNNNGSEVSPIEDDGSGGSNADKEKKQLDENNSENGGNNDSGGNSNDSENSGGNDSGSDSSGDSGDSGN